MASSVHWKDSAQGSPRGDLVKQLYYILVYTQFIFICMNQGSTFPLIMRPMELHFTYIFEAFCISARVYDMKILKDPVQVWMSEHVVCSVICKGPSHFNLLILVLHVRLFLQRDKMRNSTDVSLPQLANYQIYGFSTGLSFTQTQHMGWRASQSHLIP